MGQDDDERRRLSMTPPPYPLQDGDAAWSSVTKMVQAVNRIARRVEDIPDIKENARAARTQAQEARLEATRASTLAASLDARVERLEEAIAKPHMCVQGEAITNIASLAKAQDLILHQLVSDAAAVQARIDNLDEDTDKAHQRISQAAARRRNLTVWVIGMLIALLGTAAGAVWNVAQMAKTLELETSQRQRDQAQIIERLESFQLRVLRNKSTIEAPRAHPEVMQ